MTKSERSTKPEIRGVLNPCSAALVLHFEIRISFVLRHPSFGLGPAPLFKPESAVARPRVAIPTAIRAAAQSDSMLAFLINVKIKRHGIFAKCIGKLQAVFDRYRWIFAGMPNETGGRFFGHLQFVGQFANQI